MLWNAIWGKKFKRVILISVITIAVFGAGAAADFYLFSKIRTGVKVVPIKGVINQDNGKPSGVDFGLFWDAWRIVQEKYIGRNNLDAKKMTEGAISGMIKALGDPYTSFFNSEEEKKFEEVISGSFEGIGIEIGMRDKMLTVIAPLEGTPAKAAGIKAGDRILEIDGKDASDLTVDEAVAAIRGPKGTIVKLSILREGWKEPKEFSITRAIINVPSVSWRQIEPDIAYLAIYNFHEPSLGEFQDAAIEVYRSGSSRIILDLRNNPGGLLDYAIDIAGWFLKRGSVVAGWFLKRGSVVVKTDYGSGITICDGCRVLGNQAFLGHKIVVLVDKGTASAAEILAGALRDNLGIKLIGETTFGKGSVQELEPLSGGAALKITVAKWLTPNGTDISDKGLVPDITIENPKNGIEPMSENDLQFKKALEIVRNL